MSLPRYSSTSAQFKQVTGFFCHGSRMCTYRIGKGADRLVRHEAATATNGHSSEEDEDEDNDTIEFPGVLKHMYAVMTLPFGKSYTAASGRSGSRRRRRASSGRADVSPRDGGDDVPISNTMDAIFVLNRDFAWHVLAFNKAIATFEIVMHGRFTAPFKNCSPRSDGHVAMDCMFLGGMDSGTNSPIPTFMRTREPAPKKQNTVALYISLWDSPIVTRIDVDCPKVLLKRKGNTASLPSRGGAEQSRPATVTSGEHFLVGWCDPGCTIPYSTAEQSAESLDTLSNFGGKGAYASILGLLTVPNRQNSLVVLYKTLQTDSVFIRHCRVQPTRSQLVDGPWWAGPLDPGCSWLVRWPSNCSSTFDNDGSAALCVSPFSASLFSADGLEGHVDFPDTCRDVLNLYGVDDLGVLLRNRNHEPFETLVPHLVSLIGFENRMRAEIDVERENIRALQQQKQSTGEPGAPDVLGMVGSEGARTSSQGPVFQSIVVPFVEPSDSHARRQLADKHGSAVLGESKTTDGSNNLIVLARQRAGAPTMPPSSSTPLPAGEVSYCYFGREIETLSEIRPDENGFGCPDMFCAKNAMFLSYRVEHQTQVIPLDDDGEVAVDNVDEEDDQGLNQAVRLPRFEENQATLAVGSYSSTVAAGANQDVAWFVQVCEQNVFVYNVGGPSMGGNEGPVDSISVTDLSENPGTIQHADVSTNPASPMRVVFTLDTMLYIYQVDNIGKLMLTNRVDLNQVVACSEARNSVAALKIDDNGGAKHVAVTLWNASDKIYVFDIDGVADGSKEDTAGASLPCFVCTTNRDSRDATEQDPRTSQHIRSLAFAFVPAVSLSKKSLHSGDTHADSGLFLCAGSNDGHVYVFDVSRDGSVAQRRARDSPEVCAGEGKFGEESKTHDGGASGDDDRKVSSRAALSRMMQTASPKFLWRIGTEPITLYTFPVGSADRDQYIGQPMMEALAGEGPTVWASTSPTNSLISFSRERNSNASEYLAVKPTLHRAVCRSRSGTGGGNVGFGSTNKTIPVPSVALSGALVATVDGSGSLLFGTVDHRTLWHELNATVYGGTITGIDCVFEIGLIVVTTSNTVQFWDKTRPVCLAVHEAPAGASLNTCAYLGNGKLLVAIVHDGATTITVFQVSRREGRVNGAGNSSVEIAPIANGEFDGECQLVSVPKQGGASKWTWPSIALAIEDHVLFLVRPEDSLCELRIGHVWRSRNGNTIISLASTALDGAAGKSLFAIGEAMGPIVVIENEKGGGQGTEWGELDEKRRVVTAMAFVGNFDVGAKIVGRNNKKMSSWKLVIADRGSNTREVLSSNFSRAGAGSVLSTDSKMSSHGKRTESFFVGNEILGGVKRGTVMCIESDGAISPLE